MPRKGETSRVVRRGLIPLVVGLVAIALLFVLGETAERVGRYERLREDPARPLRDVLQRVSATLPRPGLDAGLTDSGLPVYDLKIGPRQLARLHEVMDRVQARGNTYGLVLPGYERASFLLDDEWVPVEVRLRGEEANHFVDAYPSLRLKFPATRLFERKRQINLIDPYDKYLTGDVTCNREAGRLGLLSWDSRFVVVRINDEVRGIYLETEQPRRELLDRLGRSEGPIFSADGNPFGANVPGIERGQRALARVQECFDPRAGGERCGLDFVEDYFDVERMAWAAALMGLTGHWGAWIEPNMRLYFDPARGRFEPIPWDYGIWPLEEGRAAIVRFGGAPPEGSVIGDGEGLSRLGVTLMRTPEFRRLRNERLWILAEERAEEMIESAEELFRSVEPAFEHGKRRRGATAARERHGLWVDTLRRNAALHRRLLSETSLTVAYRQSGPTPGEEAPVWRFRFENHAKATVEVAGIYLRDDPVAYVLSPPVAVPGRWEGEPGVAEITVDEMAESPDPGGVEARNVVTGESLADGDVELVHRPAMTVAATRPVEPSFDPGIPGITLEPGRLVRFNAPRVDLRETLEVPEGYRVVLDGGLELRMGPGASLIVRGDLESTGRPGHPVRIVPLDPTETWGTLAVQGRRESPRRVTLVDTVIRGGAGAETDRVAYTGSLAVHDGIVSLRGTQVLGSLAEDGINLKYCRVEIEDCRFEDHASDAVDLDFCTGTVSGSRFERSGGDALDLSGAGMLIEGNEMLAFGDKAISVGEGSLATIRDNRIAGGHMGVAVKDASGAEIVDTEVRNVQIGIGVYVKKPSFGRPSAHATRVRFHDVSTAFLRGAGARLVDDTARR